VTTGVHVDGLKDTVKALEAAGVDVNDLKDVMGGVAGEAAEVMRGYIPTASGRARDSIRPNRAKGKAIVTIGGAKVPYAHVIRHTHPSRFVERTDTAMETRAPAMLEDGVNEILTRNGLAP
jgi:hypothetical protein